MDRDWFLYLRLINFETEHGKELEQRHAQAMLLEYNYVETYDMFVDPYSTADQPHYFDGSTLEPVYRSGFGVANVGERSSLHSKMLLAHARSDWRKKLLELQLGLPAPLPSEVTGGGP